MHPDATTKLSDDRKTLTITIPINLRRKGLRKQIVAANGQDLPLTNPRKDEALIRALARAFYWRKQIESGQSANARELAAKEKIDHAYLSRIMRITLLAPDIVEAILDGRQPRLVSLDLLMGGFPDAWPDQREVLGFPDT
ncbi:hypothetical protein [Magnetofaba australis]|uniref:Putative regulatory protein of LacI family n=1 Tax=Magnetofaba australis IT-1 TaxID=1434232 RepID=A0A1Y2K522_9PROT|nr:hypothetical protein [Magnetofaba australis]OSM04784.1 putative regulatory protein of LacI family [Magnetofaba australis IT-1]